MDIKTFLQKIFGDPNKRFLKSVQKTIAQINALEPQYQALSDDALRQKTDAFKAQLQADKHLDDILPDAFATVREASVRTLNMRHFDVQLIGGIALHQGRISEMKTGEGKTLVATLAAYLNGLTGKGVYIVTVNDYLAKRDSEWMGQIYQFLGLTVGLSVSNMELDEKIEAYQSDIIYGTNNDFGFDYLRDNLAHDLSDCCQRAPHFAIVDEVDSILIDEARTPLIISGPVPDSTKKYLKVIQIAKKLKKNTHFTVEEKHKNVILTEPGIDEIESAFNLKNMYSHQNMDIAHMAVQCLKAIHLYKKDQDYVINNGEVHIVDEFTGRVLEGRRYSDGLHQAIEAAENLQINEETQTLASITYQNYFRLFPKLSGMTGTAKTEEEEFIKIYGMDVIVIPTNKPIAREDAPDTIYKNKTEKFKAVVADIKEKNKLGQPILVGTIYIETSEYLSQLLKREGIAHNVLNAKYHEQEADIIAKAGQKGSVTIATNMAGRGTDIVLGDGVKEAGGLYVLGTERHESRRIDNQLRGRSGRQGDPGKSKFYVALDDDLMRLFGSDRIANIMEKLGMPDDTPIEHKLVNRSIEKAQTKVEQHHFSIRKQILEYDNVLDKQRQTVYSLRHDILRKTNLEHRLKDGSLEVIQSLAKEYGYTSKNKQMDDRSEFIKAIHEMYPIDKMGDLYDAQLSSKTPLVDFNERLFSQFKAHKNQYPEGPFNEIIKAVLLKALDSKWMDHLHNMDVLREGIGLRAYGQQNPLTEYKIEAFDMFKYLLCSTYQESLQFLNRVELIEEEAVQPAPASSDYTYHSSDSDSASTALPILAAASSKIGRNDKVTVQKNGQTKTLKWKKAQPMVEKEGWQLINTHS